MSLIRARALSHVATLGMCLVCGGFSVPALAAGGGEDVSWVAEPDDPTPAQQAQTLFERGVSRYEVSDYPGAIENFTHAYDQSRKIEDAALRGRVLHALQFNLARAHVKAYGIDEDRQHLRIAIDLFGKYLAEGAELGIELEAEVLMERAKRELDAQKLADANQRERDRKEDSGESSLPDDGVTERDSDSRSDDEARQPGEQGADRGPSHQGRKSLRIGGYVSLGLAAVGAGMLAGGMVMGVKADDDYEQASTGVDATNAQDRGRLANSLTVAGAASFGVFGTVGVALLVVDKMRRTRGATARTIRVAPQVTRSTAGLVLGGQF